MIELKSFVPTALQYGACRAAAGSPARMLSSKKAGTSSLLALSTLIDSPTAAAVGVHVEVSSACAECDKLLGTAAAHAFCNIQYQDSLLLVLTFLVILIFHRRNTRSILCRTRRSWIGERCRWLHATTARRGMIFLFNHGRST